MPKSSKKQASTLTNSGMGILHKILFGPAMPSKVLNMLEALNITHVHSQAVEPPVPQLSSRLTGKQASFSFMQNCKSVSIYMSYSKYVFAFPNHCALFTSTAVTINHGKRKSSGMNHRPWPSAMAHLWPWIVRIAANKFERTPHACARHARPTRWNMKPPGPTCPGNPK